MRTAPMDWLQTYCEGALLHHFFPSLSPPLTRIISLSNKRDPMRLSARAGWAGGWVGRLVGGCVGGGACVWVCARKRGCVCVLHLCWDFLIPGQLEGIFFGIACSETICNCQGGKVSGFTLYPFFCLFCNFSVVNICGLLLENPCPVILTVRTKRCAREA